MPINEVQTTNRQHAVPQNIMDVEFKIIGDMTMRQFTYLLIFSALGYASFVIFDSALKWLLVAGFALSGIAFAFIPFQERGLDEWVVNFLRAMYMENQKVWRKEPEELKAFSIDNLDVVKHELITLTPTSSRRKLEEYLENQELDGPVDPLDIHEYEFIDKVREVYASAPAVDIPANTREQVAATTQQNKEEYQKTQQESIAELQHRNAQDGSEKTQNQRAEMEAHTTPERRQSEHDGQQPAQPNATQTQSTQETQPQIRKKLLTQTRPVKKSSARYRREFITPDRHTGRKFTNLLPKQGEIVLPIRGEKILQSTQEQKIQEDIDEKAKQLKQLLEQIKSDEQYAHKVTQNVEVQKEIHNTVEEAKKMVEQKETPQTQTQTQNQTPPTMPQSQAVNNQTAATEQPQRNENEIIKPKAVVSTENTPPTLPTQPESPQATATAEDKKADINPISSKPNVISGIVKDSGGDPLTGLVLIIKNDKNEPVRALKTNQLGQFAITTPLSNGAYTIETDKSKKTNLTFDIISFEATGAIIPPVEIKGT